MSVTEIDGRLTERASADFEERSGGARSYLWGFVSQGFSSATNVLLMVIAARVLGPNGLGIVTIAFVSYVSLLALLRAIVADPLMARSAQLLPAVRARASDNALTMVLIGSLGAAAVAGVVGVFLEGNVGRAFLLIAPWLPALLTQDYWRSILFRDSRSRAAAVNDAIWFFMMVVTAPFAWMAESAWAVVGVWGVGGLAGAVLGVAQTGCWPHLKGALAWWRAELWPLGRWLGVNSLGHAFASYVLVFAFASMFGAAGLGGYRAIVTIFAPLTLVASAIALPGLPALVRALAVSETTSMRLALRLGAISAAVTAGYIVVLILGLGAIVPALFGPSFERYVGLAWPIGIAQAMMAVAVGFALLLKAQGRGSAVLLSDSLAAIAALGLACALGAAYGLTAAVWGLCGGAFVWAATTVMLARSTDAGQLEDTIPVQEAAPRSYTGAASSKAVQSVES